MVEKHGEKTYKCDFDTNIKHVVYTKCDLNFSDTQY